MSTPSASCHDINTTTITAPANSKMFCTNSTRPVEINSCMASMSDVMRATILPVFSRSKKSSESDIRWSNRRLRSVAEERLADLGHEQDRGPPERQACKRHEEVQHNRTVECGSVVLLETLVDAVADERGPGEQRPDLDREHNDGDERCGRGKAATSARGDG